MSELFTFSGFILSMILSFLTVILCVVVKRLGITRRYIEGILLYGVNVPFSIFSSFYILNRLHAKDNEVFLYLATLLILFLTRNLWGDFVFGKDSL